MNCEKCQELLSDFLDGTLKGRDHSLLGAHLGECLSCADVRRELAAIVGVAHESRGEFVAPPNERALWLRIRNTIESENNFGRATAQAAGASRSRENLLSRLLHRRWELSFSQMAATVAAVAVAVSLVTTLGVQRLMSSPVVADSAPSASIEQRRNATLVAGYPRTYLEPHQANINYWQQRVQQRKASWNPRMRDSFDRSLGVLDEAVNESLSDLQQNPHDEVAEEMLNSALRDKMELLREFGEQ
ncbi:MAG: zf-HC2 domain-containing protein [Acidobacteria bacterium]|nr:zf-HC2 domain-containing protein [Acidobacteriota bacterium]